MSSLRDKFNSKLHPNRPKQQQALTCYDESYIKINVVGGQTQLCPIKLNCLWVQPGTSNKTPELSCKWFNKTETAMALIEGVNGSYYQPSLLDAGTIIHVQCMPELEGVDYEGMPIIKEIGPIKLDNETSEEANDLLEAGKATFSIKIKSIDDYHNQHEGLIKIVSSRFKLISRMNEEEKELIGMSIGEEGIRFACTRSKPKEMEIQQLGTNGKVEKILFELSSNKVRDILCMLVKLIAAKQSLQDNKVSEEEATEATMHMSGNLSEETKEKIEMADHNCSQREAVKVQQSQRGTNQDHKSTEQKVESPKKSQKSEQESTDNIDNPKKVAEVKSSEELTTIVSPSKKATPATVTPISSRHNNMVDLLQVAELKKQIKNKQAQIAQLKKSLVEKTDTIEELKQEINRIKEREANLSCNYFLLEDQMKKIKENSEKSSEEVSYHKNENRILKAENETLQKKTKGLAQQVDALESKLAPFLSEDKKQESQVQTYQQIKQKYLMELQTRKEVQAKYQYMKEQSEKLEEKSLEYKELLDKAESETNFYRKKYENLSIELQSQSSQNSPVKQAVRASPVNTYKLGLEKPSILSRSSIDSNSLEEGPKVEQVSEYEAKMQREILELKKQLKETVEENNFLRGLSVKEKKASSRQHLKLELMEIKKVVNRLTETVTEKDLALNHMKAINKELSERLQEASRRADQMQTD